MSRSRRQRARSADRKRETPQPAVPGVPGPATRGAIDAYSAKWTTALLGAGLALLTLAVFFRLRHAGFIRLDDLGYVATNANVTAGFTKSSLIWAWTTGHAANWHPLTWMSHMLDVEMFGLWAGGHHLTNVVLHTINTLLLFVLLHWTTRAPGRSAFVAALFAVHPMHVESVAWIAERKDVLSTLFWLLTMLAYARWTERKHPVLYVLACLFMGLGLLAKPMLVTLPFVLLLFDFWPLGRWTGSAANRRQLILEKIPFLALAIASSAITFMVQRQGGAMTGLNLLPFETRLANAIVSYARYLVKLVWPSDLVLFYPYREALPVAWIVGSAVMLVAFSVFAIRARVQRPYIPVGWLWFLGTLVPVIGLVQVGTQAIAERYTYVPYVGIFVVLAWGGLELLRAVRVPTAVSASLAGLITALLAVVTFHQAEVWQSNRTVWLHAAAVSPNNYLAENEVGMIYVEEGRHDDALPHFEASSRLKPEFAEARNNLGMSYVRLGRLQDALQQYQLAVQLKPGFPEAENNYAYALMGAGKLEESEAHYRAALRARPDFPGAHSDFGVLLASMGRLDEAVIHFKEAVRLEPANARPHFLLGVAYGAASRFDDAVAEFKETLRLEPSNEGARAALAQAQALGRAAGGS